VYHWYIKHSGHSVGRVHPHTRNPAGALVDSRETLCFLTIYISVSLPLTIYSFFLPSPFFLALDYLRPCDRAS
jgi:hypothetical protein